VQAPGQLPSCPPPLNPALVMTTLQCVIILLYRVRHRVFNHVGLGPSAYNVTGITLHKNVHSRRSINPYTTTTTAVYGHYTGQPALAGTCS